MGLHGFIGEFYQSYKKQVIPNLCKLIHQTKNEEKYSNLLYKASITKNKAEQ